MKKLSFLAAALLVAGAATAQNNTQTLSQTGGNGNSANVTQMGNHSSADGVQLGSSNELTQNQVSGGFNAMTSTSVGNSNKSSQEQGDGNTNTASVTQVGNSNEAKQLQRRAVDFGETGNHVTIQQVGGANKGNQEQRGLINVASATQVGIGNEANQFQGTASTHAYNSVATIEQIGLGNTATQRQTYDSHSAKIEQSGIGSTAVQEQTAFADGQAGNRAYIDQDDLGGHYARQRQTGSGNQADTYQGMSSNSSDVLQVGLNNTSVVKPKPPIISGRLGTPIWQRGAQGLYYHLVSHSHQVFVSLYSAA